VLKHATCVSAMLCLCLPSFALTPFSPVFFPFCVILFAGGIHRGGTSRPAMRVLLDALEQACMATAHAARQLYAAQQVIGSVPAVAVPGPSHPASTAGHARRSLHTLAQTVEQLLTVWLAQAAADPGLRTDSSALETLALLSGGEGVTGPSSSSSATSATAVRLGLDVAATLDGATDGSRDVHVASVAMGAAGAGPDAAYGSYVGDVLERLLQVCGMA
jgi:hypothetical protein